MKAIKAETISAANIEILFLPGGFLDVILPNQHYVIGKS